MLTQAMIGICPLEQLFGFRKKTCMVPNHAIVMSKELNKTRPFCVVPNETSEVQFPASFDCILGHLFQCGSEFLHLVVHVAFDGCVVRLLRGKNHKTERVMEQPAPTTCNVPKFLGPKFIHSVELSSSNRLMVRRDNDVRNREMH